MLFSACVFVFLRESHMTTWSWIYIWTERTCIVLPQGSEALYTLLFMVSWFHMFTSYQWLLTIWSLLPYLNITKKNVWIFLYSLQQLQLDSTRGLYCTSLHSCSTDRLTVLVELSLIEFLMWIFRHTQERVFYLNWSNTAFIERQRPCHGESRHA